MQTAKHLFTLLCRFTVKIQMRVPRSNPSPIRRPAIGPQFIRRHAQKLGNSNFCGLMRIVQSKRAGGRRQTIGQRQIFKRSAVHTHRRFNLLNMPFTWHVNSLSFCVVHFLRPQQPGKVVFLTG